MLQTVYDLNDLDESFGPPDTPEFKYQHLSSQKSGDLETKEGTKLDIDDGFFMLTTEDAPESANVSIWMLNVAETQPTKENIHQPQINIREALKEEKTPFKSYSLGIFSQKNMCKSETQHQNKLNLPQKQKRKLEKSFVLSNFMEAKTSKSKPQDKVQSRQQKQSSQPEEESKQTRQIDLTNHIEADSKKTQGIGQSKQSQLQLLPTLKQNLAKNNDQNEPLETSVNAGDETKVKEEWTDKHQRQKFFTSAIKFGQTSYRYQESISKQLGFWQIQTFKIGVSKKRKRIKPCQFWLGEKTRYLKNGLISIQHRLSIQEAFLMLNDPEEIVEATTKYVGTDIIKGQITMMPYSKVKVKQLGNILVLTVKKGNSFSFSDNKIKIIPENGRNRIFLRNAQIRSIENTLQQACTFRIKMSIIS